MGSLPPGINHQPAHVGDEIEVRIWVAKLRKEVETDWIFVEIQTDEPRSIPAVVMKIFTISVD